MEHWQPVLQGKSVDNMAAEHYLDRRAPKTDFNRYRPPDDETPRRFANRSSSISPGMDGPPYIA
eukprot:339722-Pyramimonas_sp.AAC.1